MIQQDKFGKHIPNSTFRIVKDIAERLERIGYIKMKNNPNLFCYKSGDVTFYVDFRGTNEVPIWIDPKPLIYWFPKEVDENLWLSILSHFELLSTKGIPKRIPFYEEYEPGGLSFDLKEFTDKYLSKKFNIPVFVFEHGLLVFTDQEGKCHNDQCGRRFNAPGFFCSDRCREVYIKRILASEINTSKKFCAVCGTIILEEGLLETCRGFLDIRGCEEAQIHHVSYFPEKTILVCKNCHQKIHHTEEFQELKPPTGDSKKFYNGEKNVLPPRMVCTWCEHEWVTRKNRPTRCPRCRSEYIFQRFSVSYICPHCKRPFLDFNEFMKHTYIEKSAILKRVAKVREKRKQRMLLEKIEEASAYARKMGLR